jgi:hypothetical protein
VRSDRVSRPAMAALLRPAATKAAISRSRLVSCGSDPVAQGSKLVSSATSGRIPSRWAIRSARLGVRSARASVEAFGLGELGLSQGQVRQRVQLLAATQRAEQMLSSLINLAHPKLGVSTDVRATPEP